MIESKTDNVNLFCVVVDFVTETFVAITNLPLKNFADRQILSLQQIGNANSTSGEDAAQTQANHRTGVSNIKR